MPVALCERLAEPGGGLLRSRWRVRGVVEDQVALGREAEEGWHCVNRHGQGNLGAS